LNREDLLWAKAVNVSQQALDKRLLNFPAVLFEQVLMQLLPSLQARWQTRQQRPLPTSLAWTHQHFGQIWVVDGSPLETLFRKLESLQQEPAHLAGKLYAVVDLVTHLPVKLWLEENPFLNDTVVWSQLLPLSPSGTLLIFDRGFYDFGQFAAVVERGSAWLSAFEPISLPHLHFCRTTLSCHKCPRTQNWQEHFALSSAAIMPLTAEGRVTVLILQLNHPDRLQERKRLISIGQYP
jgi:hypothetical protein